MKVTIEDGVKVETCPDTGPQESLPNCDSMPDCCGTKPPPLRPGNVVQLRSGGPAMTVAKGPDDQNSVVCTWMDANAVFSERFSVTLLQTWVPE